MGSWLKEPAQKEAALTATKTVAVVGLKDNPDRPAYGVAKVLQGSGYKIFPVHPAGGTVLGEPVWTSLAEVPVRVDMVDVFRNPANLPDLLLEVLKLPADRQPRVLWFQDGAMHEPTATQAAAAGYDVVMTDCVARVLYRMAR